MSSKRFQSIALVASTLAAAMPAAAQDSTSAGQQTQRHIVQQGETLWAIARLYFGDPLLWPEIYRLNTMVVEDPHWIFPGEELLLVPGDRTQVAITPPADTTPAPVPPPAQPTPVTEAVTPPVVTPPPQQQVDQSQQRQVEVELPTEAAPAPPPPPISEGQTVFARRAPAGTGSTVSFGPSNEYRILRVGDFYGAGFLTEGQDFPWADVIGNADPAGVRALLGRTALLGQVLHVRAPAGANYQVGDSLVTYRLVRDVRGGWGKIAQPTAIVRILHVAGRDVLGDVVTEYDQVRGGQLALPAEPYPDPGFARPQPVADGVQGAIITLRALREVPKQFDVLFINLGRNAGVAPGDVFDVLPRPEDVQVRNMPAEAVAQIQIVHVRDRSATALLTGIYTLGIRGTVREAAGAPVRLIRKMPS